MRRAILAATAAGLAAAHAAAGAALAEQPPPVPPAVDAPLFTQELWDSLPPLDASMMAWVGSRLSGVDATKVRELSFEDADAVIGQAVARGYAGSDLFSDRGLRTDRLFLLREAETKKIFDRYEMRVLTLPSGVTENGEPYAVQGLLLGGGRVALMYSLSEFEFHNPYFPKYKFRFRDPVVYTIRGDGDLGMEGASVKVHLLWTKINRFVKVPPDDVRVETSLGSTTDPLSSIRRKDPTVASR